MTDVDPKEKKGNNVIFGSATNERFKNFLMQLTYLGLSDHFIFARTSNFTEEAKKIIKIMMKTKYAYPSNGIFIFTHPKSRITVTYPIIQRPNCWIGGLISRYLKKIKGIYYFGILIITMVYRIQIMSLGHGTPWWHTQDTAVSDFIIQREI